MVDIDYLLDQLWDLFRQMNPQAQEIHQLLADRGEAILNDHIAFRTFDDPRVNVEFLARPFLEAGYLPQGEYEFPKKHLLARHFEHTDPQLPKIFISQLKLGDMTKSLRQIATGFIDQISPETFERDDFCAMGRPWDLDYTTYEHLVQESEYAGWLSAFGFCANHFTVLVNRLNTIVGLEKLNEFLKSNGFELNSAGGEIKGSPVKYLEQSSTLAAKIEVPFTDGLHRIPSCYYEFAHRYQRPDGTTFSGFIAQSADKIFESTDRRKA